MVNLADSVFGEAAALEAGGVQSVSASATFGSGFREGKDVASDRRPAADECMRADANKMVHRTKRSHRGPFFHDDVSAQSCGVGEDDVVSDHAIMRNVGVGHDESVAADASEASAFHGATIDGDEFADGVVVADFEARGFVFVTQILRRESDGGKREEAVARADLRGAFNGDVGDQLAVFAEFDARADGAVRADFARRMNFHGGIDNGGGMGMHCVSYVPSLSGLGFIGCSRRVSNSAASRLEWRLARADLLKAIYLRG
jgi:hypothetical protein